MRLCVFGDVNRRAAVFPTEREALQYPHREQQHCRPAADLRSGW